jgi:hypothetical protein
VRLKERLIPLNLKELIVVVVIAAVIFTLAKPIALRFTAEADFRRRRNVWFVLTAAAFLSPSFLLYAIIAVPVLMWAGRKDTTSVALGMLLLQVIPAIDVPVPMVGLSRLFAINNYLLLSFCVFVPAALRLLRAPDPVRIRGWQVTDVVMLAYGALTSVLYLRTQEGSGVTWAATYGEYLRHAFVFFFKLYVPYFVITRSVSNRRAMLDVLAAFCLGCCLMAAIAMFESGRHWLLYADMDFHWGYPSNMTSYLARAGQLRARASTDHPIELGTLLAYAFGFWLVLRTRVKSAVPRWLVSALLWGGLLAAYSRGPWFGALCIYAAFITLRSQSLAGLLRSGSVLVFLLALVALTPFAGKFVNAMPFLGGTVDAQSLDYREQLLTTSWSIIKQSPVLGNQQAILQMQSLRQGQHIIDIVNTYVGVLLSAGFVGLTLFLTLVGGTLLSARAWSRRILPVDPELGLLGASLVACMLGMLLMLADGSFENSVEWLFYAFAGLAVAYAQLCRVSLLQPVGLSTDRPRAAVRFRS